MSTPQLSFGVITEALQGQTECGDQYCIKPLENATLIAIADGIGHGIEAAVAAKEAMQCITDTPSESLIDIVKTCHLKLKKTRGVVLGLVYIQSNYQVSWLGVGNIIFLHWKRNLLEQATKEILTQGGIVGLQLPQLHISTFTINPGDTFILTTDGINRNVIAQKPLPLALPQQIAEHIFKTYRNPKDDALTLVIQRHHHDEENERV